MRSTAQRAPEPRDEPAGDFDLLAQEPAPSFDEPRHGVDLGGLADPDDLGQAAARSPVLVEPDSRRTDEAVPHAEGGRATEYVAGDGMPGRGVVLSTLLASAVCVGTDFALTGRLTVFFDLCFVVICLIAAMGVRRRDLFTAGVLPPLVFGLLIGAISVLAPAALAASGGIGTVFMTGLASHADGLVAGYATALLTVGARVGAHRS